MSLAPKIAMSDDFLKSFAAVPRSSQQAVLTFVAKFRQNPMATGINYERIINAGDPNMRSVRINDNLRGIVLKPDVGNVYCLLWVDVHDDAYKWASRHKVAIHPDLGSIQIYAVQAGQDEVTKKDDSNGRDGLFGELKDREIRRFGVPDDMLGMVRTIVTVEELDALEQHLPEEAFEALYLYAAGDSYESIINSRDNLQSVDQTDYSAALDRDSSRRHFVVITEDSDLDALLAAPLDRWRVFLHPSQRKIIERDWNGPVKVTGGAGTGKTVVAMHRAARLARQYASLPGRPVVFTTFTKTLAEDIRQQLAILCTPQELEKILVVNIDQWASSLLRRFGYPHNLLYNDAERRKLWQSAMSVLPASVEFSPQFMRAEYERVVMPQGCESADDYMRASRVGRGGQIGRVVRKSIWPVFAEYRAQLQAANLREPEDAFREAVQILRAEKPTLGIRAMIVDEAQDISPSGFELIRTAVPESENDIFIVGDAHQRIYRHKVVLNRVGISVRGRSRNLRINYRTTDEIRRWACAQLEGCEVDDLDGDLDSLRGYRSLTHGDKPLVIDSESINNDAIYIRDLLNKLNDAGIESRQICVVSRTNDDIVSLSNQLSRLNINFFKLDSNTTDDDSSLGIRLATMHRIKGLEFSVIIIAAYQGIGKYTTQFSRDEDEGVTADAEMSERCLLHVAATRAKRNLFVLKRSD